MQVAGTGARMSPDPLPVQVTPAVEHPTQDARVSPDLPTPQVTHQEDDLVADTPQVDDSEVDEQVDVERRLFATLSHRQGPRRVFGRKPIKDFFTSYKHETRQGDAITRPLSVLSYSSGAESDDVGANRAE
jgi:hypothetical protein